MKHSISLSSMMTALAVFSFPAFAADPIVDNGVYAPVPVVQAESKGFCDAYAGVQAGYVWGEAEYSGPIAQMYENNPYQYFSSGKNDGATGGLYAGCNFNQPGPFVWGVEGDVNLMGKSGGGHQDWYGTLRLRAGSNIGQTLIYATGGLAFGQIDAINNGDATLKMMIDNGMYSIDTPLTAGWTVGGGVEHWFSDKVSWKTEYLYVDLGKVTTMANTYNGSNDLEAKWNAHTVRTGIAIHF